MTKEITVNLFDDNEVLLIESTPKSDTKLIILLKLRALAQSLNANGKLILNGRVPYTIEMLSKILRKPKKTIENALDTFKQLGIIEILEDNSIVLTSMSNIPFDKSKLYTQNVQDSITLFSNKSTESEQNVGENKQNVEENKQNVEENEQEEHELFIKPTLKEITQYIDENEIDVIPSEFYDECEAKNWTFGNQKIKDWQLAIRIFKQKKDLIRATNKLIEQEEEQEEEPVGFRVIPPNGSSKLVYRDNSVSAWEKPNKLDSDGKEDDEPF